jgi:predicted Fe-Mo cluster-binding NifX family protein
MKLAIATDDFRTVTGHIGRCNGFLIYEIKDSKIKNVEQRDNVFTNHKMNGHVDKQDHSHNHRHSHASLVEGLADCSHLICTAAGWRLQEDFSQAGKELIFTNEKSAEEAALKFSNGTLAINTDGACHSH